ncbi:beta-1,3-galactosyltransferase 6-like [Paramuricea clavata]|uniref:Hexosyltransferase n=1 Tax=Paramuricea clavata TaxID=317549 RepID=A0A6S7IWG9_PARCT|nr:beta-1,3-galactosyltransferase 6-like [Paramuricea clavata]
MLSNPPRMPKEELFLFVGIVSAPSRLDRRNAIRETWIKECQCNPDAVCRFFTDGQDPKGQALQGENISKLENESRVYGDILLADAPGGINFAIKYLWMLQWVHERYDVRYFLRLDDDYFICFRKLMAELKFRPKEKFLWGWLHCSHKVATWLDESFYLVSGDIVESFVSRRDTLLCHVFESQAIGYWIKNISNLTTFADNKRLLHASQKGFSTEKDVVNRGEICHSVLGIHQSYPEKMRMLWRTYEKENKPIAYQVPSISYNCKYPLAMDHKFFRRSKFWFAKLKLCKDNPIWNRSGEYKGRNGPHF